MKSPRCPLAGSTGAVVRLAGSTTAPFSAITLTVPPSAVRLQRGAMTRRRNAPNCPRGAKRWPAMLALINSNGAAGGKPKAQKVKLAAMGELPPHPYGRSPSGGRWLVFQDTSQPICTAAGTPKPGIDPKAGRCAFTICPSKRQGSPYRWIEPLWVVSPPKALSWLLAALAPPPEPKRRAAPELTSDRASRILRNAGRKVQAAVNGHRNEALNIAAYTAGALHVAGVLGEREAVFYLYGVGVGVGIGLTDAECRATIKSGFNTGVKNPMKDRRNG